jgi:YHS domain-containing protein
MTLQPAVTKVIDPVCGMKINPDTAREAGLTAEAEGTTFYFCSEECHEQFKQDPLRYLKAPQTPPAAHEGHGHAQPQPTLQPTGHEGPDHSQPSTPTAPPSRSAMTMQPAAVKAIDPVCGMKVNPDTAREAGLIAEVEGTTYFFCSEECREQFQQDPLRYLKAPQTPPEGHEGHGHAQPHH